MMEDEIVKLKTARLAKEKGFREEVYHYYNDDNRFRRPIEHSWKSNHSDNEFALGKEVVSAPSQALLQRWLRDSHQMYVCVDPVSRGKGIVWRLSSQVHGYFKTYENALEAGLFKALERIPSEYHQQNTQNLRIRSPERTSG